jgi:hypothetical protein
MQGRTVAKLKVNVKLCYYLMMVEKPKHVVKIVAYGISMQIIVLAGLNNKNLISFQPTSVQHIPQNLYEVHTKLIAYLKNAETYKPVILLKNGSK